MTPFMTEDFLLDTEFARRLYHDYAKDQPIFDYHCHLPPQQIAEDYRFKNLYDIWLKGDHYKWRAMRTNGVAERLCTGDASDREKFDAWAATVPHTIGNPLYHWTHLELRRPFGITGKLLSPSTADEIWNECNELLAQDNFSARGIMQQMNVKMVGTTDDPIDSLEHHAEIAKDGSFTIKVLPSWRPDKAFNIEQATFNDYMAKLGEVSDTDIRRFADLQTALTKRLDHFAAHGCKVSDHALDVVMFAEANEAELDSILARRLAGEPLSEHEVAQFKTAVLVFLGAEYARRGWVQQYHIGALRNNNLRQFKLLGPDVGFDSINMDLIAGLPGDTVESFERSLRQAIALDPENITVHTLTLKRASRIVIEDQKENDYADVAAMLEKCQLLADAGYRPYYLYRQKNTLQNLENVGWCKPGHEGYYNIYIMEEVQTILSAGAGGSTKLVADGGRRMQRIFNFKYPTEYIQRFAEVLERKKGVADFYDHDLGSETSG